MCLWGLTAEAVLVVLVVLVVEVVATHLSYQRQTHHSQESIDSQ